MIEGFQNEQNFSYYFNNKKIKDLPKLAQELIFTIFNNVDEDSFVLCWKSKYLEKADIKIKINGIVKGVSIKSGQQCSMHQEKIESFDKFLLRIGVEENIINKFNNFIKGEVNNKRVDAKTYISLFQNDIEDIKRSFNTYSNKIHLIMRFIFHGTENQLYDCDALIYGTPDSYIWATKDEILKFLIESPNINVNFLNVSLLNIRSYNRNLKGDTKQTNKENNIQVKWFSLPRDIEYLSKIREANLIKTDEAIFEYVKNCKC